MTSGRERGKGRLAGGKGGRNDQREGKRYISDDQREGKGEGMTTGRERGKGDQLEGKREMRGKSGGTGEIEGKEGRRY